jgi:hypothetical protein
VAAAANHHLNDVQPPTMSHPTAGQRQLAVDDLLPLVGQGPAHLGQEIKVSDSIPLSLNMIIFVGFTLTSPMVLTVLPMVLTVLQLWH